MKSISWNPWHGCHKISPGCLNCYVYRRDSSCQRDASKVIRTKDFYLPVRRDRRGEYKIPPGTSMDTCFTSDFFVEEADEWRREAFEMMKIRSDLSFFFITKRIDRLKECLPDDWGEKGYPNVDIACTVENQKMADFRIPIYLSCPLRRYTLCLSPLLEKIDLKDCLAKDKVSHITAAGESGSGSRLCDYDWILDLRDQAQRAGIGFYFMQTGALFKKDGKIYNIPRKLQHSQARKAGINLRPLSEKALYERDQLPLF